MADSTDWRRSFARQAQSDLHVYDSIRLLKDVPACHRLHYLQMACEKLVKAQLVTQKSIPANLFTSHAVIKKHLLRPLAHAYRQQESRVIPKPLRQHLKHIAGEIELLSPALDRDGSRPDNCEYPWELSDGQVQSPLDFRFAVDHLLRRPAGVQFIKLVRQAIRNVL